MFIAFLKDAAYLCGLVAVVIALIWLCGVIERWFDKAWRDDP